MSANKKVFDFVVGDPKSNQQTASNASCNVTINNISPNGSKSSSEETLPPLNLDYKEDSSEIDSRTVPSEPIVSIPVRQEPLSRQVSTQRYLTTSPMAEITPEEIRAKISFFKKLHEIENSIIVSDNKLPPAQQRDEYGCAIISANDLAELIATMLSNDVQKVEPGDIVLKLQEIIIKEGGCLCGKPIIDPRKEILAIKISGRDFGTVYNEAYNMLSSEFKISTCKVYQFETVVTHA